jgi:hypothetical protein
MAIRIDPTITLLRERVQEQIADDVASNRRSPYSEVALPLNAELLSRQECIDSQRARIKQLEAEVERLREVLNYIASWGDGQVVNSSFDEPDSAKVARKALEQK